MSDRFYILGESNSSNDYLDEVVRQSGLKPIYFSPTPEKIAEIGQVSPVAVLVERGVQNRREVVDLLRAEETMVTVPLIARLTAPEPEAMQSVFQDGFDEFLVDGSKTQLAVMCDLLQNRSIQRVSSKVVGTILVADPDPRERIRLAYPLKRSGFDIHFAANCEELERAIENTNPRVVVANSDLPGGSIPTILKSSAGRGSERRPWIFVSSESSPSPLRSELSHMAQVEFVDSHCAVDSVSFKINELLTPLPPGRRNSRRLVYATPVRFEYTAGSDSFFGYCYNVNLGGLFIRTLTPLPMKTEINLRFRPPFGKGQVAVTAQVAWRSTFAQGNGTVSRPGIGVQFLEWDLADWAGFEAGYEALLTKSDSSPSVAWNSNIASSNPQLLSHSSTTIHPTCA